VLRIVICVTVSWHLPKGFVKIAKCSLSICSSLTVSSIFFYQTACYVRLIGVDNMFLVLTLTIKDMLKTKCHGLT